jgi:hypothetical protein
MKSCVCSRKCVLKTGSRKPRNSSSSTYAAPNEATGCGFARVAMPSECGNYPGSGDRAERLHGSLASTGTPRTLRSAVSHFRSRENPSRSVGGLAD